MIRSTKEEGHYTIKRVDRLPKKGNYNWLYILKADRLEVLYKYTQSGEYEEIPVGSIYTPLATGNTSIADASTGVTIVNTDTREIAAFDEHLVFEDIPLQATTVLKLSDSLVTLINTVPSLDQVTTVGNATENNMSIGTKLDFYDSVHNLREWSMSSDYDLNFYAASASATNPVFGFSPTGYFYMVSAGGQIATLDPVNMSSDRNFTFPDKSGVIALTSDIGSLEGYFESGGRLPGTLIVTIGDYDNSNKQTKITVDSNAEKITMVSEAGVLVEIVGGSLEVAGTVTLSKGSGMTTTDGVLTTIGNTAQRTYNFPDKTGTVALVGDAVDNLQFDTAATPIASAPGLLQWNSAEGTLDLNTPGATYQLGQEIAPLVRNSTGITIPNGTPVMFAGTLGASGRILITPAISDGTIPSSYILGMTTEEITNGQDGYATWFGKVRDLDTTGTPYGEVWADGDILYVSPTTAGDLTNVKPQAPNPQIFMGVVINTHASNGTIFTRPSWRGKLTDLDDVNGTPLTVDGQLLVWDDALQVFDFTKNINDYSLKEISYTVATLPAGTVGDKAMVTDATTPTYLGTLTGGGAITCLVFYNGTNWVSH